MTSEPAAEAAATEPASATAEAVAPEATPAESKAEGGTGAAETQSPAAPATSPPATMQELLDRGTPEEIDAALLRMEHGENPFAETEAKEPARETENEEPESEEKPDAEDEHEPRLPKRLKISDRPIQEQVAMTAAMDLLRKDAKLSLREALERVGYLQAAEAAGTEPAAPAEPPKAVTPDHDAKIAELLDRQQAAFTSFDFAAASELGTQIDAAREARLLARMDARQAASRAQAELSAQVDANVAAIRRVAPDFNTPGTPLQAAVEQIGAEFERTSPAFFTKANWPQRLFALAWAEAHPDQPMPALKAPANGVKPAAPVAKAVLPTVPKRNGAPAPMLSAGRSPADPVTTQFQRAMRPDATVEEIDAALAALEPARRR